jgi:superfamily II DNA or RNA helicase
MGKIIVSDKFYVPSIDLSEKRVKKEYFKNFFSDFGCKSCDFRPKRPVPECKGCENFNGSYQLANKRVIGNVEYIGLPMGDRNNIEEKMKIDFDDYTVVDKRTRVPFDYKIKISLGEDRDWYSYQLKTVEKMKKAKYGLFVLPPRSGKSLTALKIAIELGYKVLLIADQYDFLNQFLGDIRESTNLPALEKKTGKKLFGFIKTAKDLEDIQIGIITYQSFLSPKGRKFLAKVNKVFGTVIVDEVQATGAPEFADVMNSMKMRVRMGCTGTETRKDGKHIITALVIGEVKSKIKRGQMVAKLLAVDTGVKSKGAFKGKPGFVFLGKMLAKHKKRNDLIIDWVMKDLEAGHSIVIPCHFKDHIEELVKRINDRVGYEVAAAFTGGSNPKKNKERRDWIKQQAGVRKIRVVVGIRRLLQRGINIKPWSCLYYVMPMNNEPNWKQESSRILTPDPDKRQPIIRFFVDTKANASLKYCSNTWNQAVEFNHTPTPVALERMGKWLKNVKRDISYEEQDAETETSAVARIPTGGLFGGIAASIHNKRNDAKDDRYAKKKMSFEKGKQKRIGK